MAGLLALALAGFSYLQVRLRFGRPLWDHPSRIYSDSLALYPGLALHEGALEEELRVRGYRKVARAPSRPGEYRRNGRVFDIYLNTFSYPHEKVRGYPVEVHIGGGGVDRLGFLENRHRLDVVVLEPRLLGRFYGDLRESRSVVALKEIPEILRRAVIEVEDRHFMQHHGLDVRGMARALWQDLRAGDLVQGGSTITQQVVKNVLLGHQRTFARKVREALMAPLLERMLSKEEILEIYMNEIYMGQKGAVSIVGMGEAARFFFGRQVRGIDLPQAALLAGLIRSPGSYNPWKHPEAARKRRDQVLDLLRNRHVISPAQEREAKAQDLALADTTATEVPEAAYFLDLVRAQLQDQFGARALRREGLRIFTTLDTRLQKAASAALSRGLEKLEAIPAIAKRLRCDHLQGALVVMNPRTGAILGLAGGRNFAASPFNRAVDARRQIGSLFKPFVYLAAFEAARSGAAGGLTPASLLRDEPLSIRVGKEVWRPTNNDHRFRGPVSVRESLAKSINVPAVRAAQGVGIDRVADLAIACGLPADMPRVPALALGSAEASPLQVAVAFSTLAAEGFRPFPHTVRWVMAADGGSLGSQRQGPRRVVSSESAYLVVDLMREAIRSGTARRVGAAGLAGEVAGKTGTTNGRRDAWFVGFTPDILAAVWVGFDDNHPLGMEGSQAALPIWLDLVQRVKAAQGHSFRPPEDVVFRWIDPATGGLATRRCPARVKAAFLAGSAPTTTCPAHRRRGFWRRLFGR